MSNNTLQKYFRQASVYVKLPSKGLWYKDGSVELTQDGELPIFPLSAIDDILLNTPDAMLNGQALEKVVANCAPNIKNVKRIMLPDLEAIFLGIKSATNNGKMDYERKCEKCNHENSFELNCGNLLDSASFIEESDTQLVIDNKLRLYIKPYDFEMRQMFIRREFEEERLLKSLDQQANQQNMDELTKARVLGESVERLSKITFELVSRSIDKIVEIDSAIEITDRNEINMWLTNISKQQADIVIEAVNTLNAVGIPKAIPVQCSNCGHMWTDTLTFDPSSFFGKRS